MKQKINSAIDEVSKVLLGKEQQIKLSLACLFAKGHLLIEDLPGMGKTTLSHALAKTLGLSYKRIQFTSDMLPSDIIGATIFNQNTAEFTFHPGPIFTQILLADEINRTTPKTQSALLEAMEERQVTVEGETHILPTPFFVIATQNPLTQSGTYPLPESQIDRFLMNITLGYPDPEAERALIAQGDTREKVDELKTHITAEDLHKIQTEVTEVEASEAIVDYIQRIVQHSRTSDEYPMGLSPRGALAILKSAKAWAYVSGRQHVLPEDIQQVFGAVVAHRLLTNHEQNLQATEALAEHLLHSIEVLI